MAAIQWGLFTARQAVRAGVSRWDLSRLAGDGAIEPVGYGVYRVIGAPQTPFLDVKVAWLQLAPEAIAEDRGPSSGVVSHTSAAMLYRAGDFEPDLLEFTRPVRFRTRRSDVAVHVDRIDSPDVRWVDQLLVTTPNRLARDLLADHHDGEHVGRVFSDLIVAELIDHDDLVVISGPYASSYGLDDSDGAGLVEHLTRSTS